MYTRGLGWGPPGSLMSDINRPKFSTVDQSTPGVSPKYREAPRNIWYRGTLGHIVRFTAKRLSAKKVA